MRSDAGFRFLSTSIVLLLLLTLSGCRRNVLRITSTPPGAKVFVEGDLARLEDTNRRLARRIDSKKTRRRNLNEEEAEFDRRRREIQTTPLEYEIESIAAGYQIYCQYPGYKNSTKIEYVKPRWYEYPPIDLFVDLFPFTITNRREVNFLLEPK